MNEGKNTFIWKSKLAPVAAGVPIENDLLFQILSFLDNKIAADPTLYRGMIFPKTFEKLTKINFLIM